MLKLVLLNNWEMVIIDSQKWYSKKKKKSNTLCFVYILDVLAFN